MNIEQKAQAILADDSYEFWKSSGAKAIVSTRDRLVKLGVSKEDAADIIRDIWCVASEEYGN